MTPTFRSTTALAAALALLMPHPVLAETILDATAAAEMDAASRANQPNRAAALDRELGNGLTADQLTCAETNGPRPCPDGTAMMTPKGLAVHVGEDGRIALAPRGEQQEAREASREGDGADKDKDPGKDKKAAREERKDRKARKAESGVDAVDQAQPEAGDDVGAPMAIADASGATADAPLPTPADAASSAAPAEPVAENAQAQSEAAPENQDAPAPDAASAGGESAGDAPAAAASAAAPVVDAPVPADAPAEPLATEAIPPVTKSKTPEVEAPKAASTDTPAIDDAAAQEAARKAIEAQGAAEQAQTTPESNAPATPIPAEKPAAEVADAPTPTPAPQAQTGKADTDAAALGAALAAATGGTATPAGESAATAASGQPEAPQAVEVSAEQRQSLDDALAAAAAVRKSAAETASSTAATRTDGVDAPAAPTDAKADTDTTGAAPDVAALSAPARISDDASAVVVTEGSARSSAEDFATKLSDQLVKSQQAEFQRMADDAAARAAAGQAPAAPQSASRDDKDSDLGKMLLAGIGGYVAGQLLSQNAKIALNTGDRVVVQRPDGTQQIIKNDDALLLQPGARVTTENFADGSTRTVVTREDGSRVVTIRDGELRVLRRTLIAANGNVTELIDETAQVPPVVVSDLPPPARPVDIQGPVSEEALRGALAREAATSRQFSLSQIRNIAEVRALVAPVNIDAITFNTGSAAINPDQAQQLATLGKVISDYVRNNPREMFLIEGHTDTVGSDAVNLALSDRRAESVALALTEYFRVPPENLVVQGYGEQFLKVNQQGDIRANRRAAVRRITDLLATK